MEHKLFQRLFSKAPFYLKVKDQSLSHFRKTACVSLFVLMAGGLSAAEMEASSTAVSTSEVKKMSGPAVITQQRNTDRINGTVSDEYGDPLIGVNVTVEGTSNGTITNSSGQFSLMAAPGQTLVVSYVGYETQNVKVGNNRTLNITLREDSQALEEVVVVGYGTQKKVNLSGSVTSVNVGELSESRPITNLSSALAGVAAGVQVTSASNRPGEDDATIYIRGIGTLNDATPLVIIDGVEGTLSNVDVKNVESISILKDASSSAIYGSRAANGVILVTTKKGRTGKMKIGYDGYVTFQTARTGILEPVSNYADYMEYINEGYTNSGSAAVYDQSAIDEWRADNGANPLQYPNTNWVEQTFQTGVGHNHLISIEGGSEDLQYYGSVGYYDNPGIMENSGYERFHVTSNLSANITKWLKAGINLNGYRASSDLGSGTIGYTYATSPAMIFEYDGKYGGMQATGADISESQNNPLLAANAARGYDISRYAKAHAYMTITPFKDLSITGNFVYEITDQHTKYIPVWYDIWDFSTMTVLMNTEGQSYVNQTSTRYERNFMDVSANYGHRFLSDRLGFNVMIGASQEQYVSQYESITKYDLTDISLSVLDAANGDSSTSGSESTWTMQSLFGRVNLDWDNKYLLEFSVRSDASSRFLSDNRRGWFPSGSAAWRINQEDFMKDVHWLDNLKLRLSYGTLGNNSVGNYAARSTYGIVNYTVANTLTTGWAITYLANPNLEWEKTNVFDVGVDFNVLHNRLSATVDYFDKRTHGILISLPTPSVHGTASSPTTNAAKVSNKGIEITLGWNDKIGKVSYGASLNYTHVKNNIDKFQGDDYSLSDYTIIQEGGSIGDMYMYKLDRIIQTEEDMQVVEDMLAANADAFSSLGTPTYGDALFVDVNGDGVIDADDRTIVGNTNPTDYLGLSLYAAYNNFDFSISFDGAFGFQGYVKSEYFTTTVSKDHQLSKYIVEHCWREGVTDALYPALSSSGNIATTNNNTIWVQDRDYLKIRNIQLGYTLPKQISRKIFLEKLRVYGSLENFFTFTGWKGIDPETDNLSYPTSRQAVIGINVEF